MKEKIILPNNNIGGCIMLILLLLAFTIPFTLTLWLVSMIAPWWVSLPAATAVAVVVFLCLVKFKQ